MDQVIKVLKSGMIVQGAQVAELEAAFNNLCKTKYAVATNSGTAALHTALYAIGIQPSDEIITTPFSFIASTNCILMMGAKPVYVDIDPTSFNIDPHQIEKAITKKTKAILVVDLYGTPADYTIINNIAKKHNLLVIEDAAQSINAVYRKKKTGSLADIACFSLYATKNITSSEGGMITTNKKDFFERAKVFRNQGQSTKQKYNYVDLGFNYRMTNLEAAIGLAQFTRIESVTKKRKKIAELYTKAFKDIKGIILPAKVKNAESVWHQYTMRITKDFKLSRDKMRNHLLTKGIQTEVYYPHPLYSYPHIQKIVGKIKELPNVFLVSKEVLSLPIYPSLSDDEVRYIIKTITNI